VSVIHLKPPKRHQPPRWLKQPLGKFQSAFIPWPRAWAALLLIINGLAHLARAAWVIVAAGDLSITSALLALFGLEYLLLGIWLTRPSARALGFATLLTASGLVLGAISFVTSFDSVAGVNWVALILLLLDVLIVPLCAAGLQLPLFRRSATPPPNS
jgi:hypothetical protein